MTTTDVDEAVTNSPVSGYQPSPSLPALGEGNRGPAPQPEHSEGALARAIEQQTAKLPSDTFLWAALSAMGVSLGLQLLGRQHTSLFVGQWAPSFLLLGIYNKLVKVAGSH